MRVLMLIDRYAPIWGGAENQLAQLIPLLAARGITCTVLTRRWKSGFLKREKINGVDVVRVGIPGSNVLSTAVYVMSVLVYLVTCRKKWDIIHTHGAAALGILGVIIARLFSKKSVVKIATAGRIPQIQRLPLGGLLIRILGLATGIVALSKEIERELAAINVASENIIDIKNGVDTSIYAPVPIEVKHEIRKKMNIPENAIVTLFCSRIVKRKGLDIALKAWKDINEDNENWFYIAGSGTMQKESNETECREYVKRNSLENIVFTGDVSNVREVLQCSDVFLFPSRREGLPNALLEAMAAGIPVVAAAIGGVTEIVVHGKTGLLFEKDNYEDLSAQMKRLLGSAQLRHDLAEAARKHIVEHYSIENIAQKYEVLYKTII